MLLKNLIKAAESAGAVVEVDGTQIALTLDKRRLYVAGGPEIQFVCCQCQTPPAKWSLGFQEARIYAAVRYLCGDGRRFVWNGMEVLVRATYGLKYGFRLTVDRRDDESRVTAFWQYGGGGVEISDTEGLLLAFRRGEIKVEEYGIVYDWLSEKLGW